MDTFQQTIFKLKQFWAKQGCVIQEPYDVEVGAGTMCPETFLRVLGPRPYNVAYVQPSRRPADGRYGENPNRLYKHSQLQVILKPAPANVMELYLESLEAVGIRLDQHDLKFEEDNWESPTLGAWGIGWQVMLDGHRGDAVHLLPAVRRRGPGSGAGGADLRVGAAGGVPAGPQERVRDRVGGGDELRRRAVRRRSSSSRFTTSRRPTWRCCGSCWSCTKPRRSG